jgi:uncharacterized membrane protein (DUF485 family)
METSTHEMLQSKEFRRLVTRRWTVSVLLTAALFVLYYGYILLVALNRPLMAQRIGEHSTLGIPLGVAVIVGAWVLTAVYVLWANAVYDPAVTELKQRLRR